MMGSIMPYTNNSILKGGVVIPLIFPKVPQSSRLESLGFPSYPLPLNNPALRTLQSFVRSLLTSLYGLHRYFSHPRSNISTTVRGIVLHGTCVHQEEKGWSKKGGPQKTRDNPILHMVVSYKWWVSPTNPWVILLKIIILGCEMGVSPFEETPIFPTHLKRVFFQKKSRTFQRAQENAHFTATQIDSDTKATQPDVGKHTVKSYKTILGCPWKFVTIVASKLVYNLLKGLTTYLYRGYPVTKNHGHSSMEQYVYQLASRVGET